MSVLSVLLLWGCPASIAPGDMNIAHRNLTTRELINAIFPHESPRQSVSEHVLLADFPLRVFPQLGITK